MADKGLLAVGFDDCCLLRMVGIAVPAVLHFSFQGETLDACNDMLDVYSKRRVYLESKHDAVSNRCNNCAL